jgi:hypothetical protein
MLYYRDASCGSQVDGKPDSSSVPSSDKGSNEHTYHDGAHEGSDLHADLYSFRLAVLYSLRLAVL